MDANTQTGAKTHTKLARVSFQDGQGELPAILIDTAWSNAEVYLHGAHVTQFNKKDEPPLLFLSQCSRFAAEQPIRGGIPIILPWFGMREGLGQHGFARYKTWELKEVVPASDGSVSLKFQLPDCPEASAFTPLRAEYVVTVKETLNLRLLVTNLSTTDVLPLENCLHTYFEVADSSAISIKGLKGARYLDKVANFAEKTETADAIRVSSEVDRVYLDTKADVEIIDPKYRRKILVQKQGSSSTVVWNPWIDKAQQMPDFANEEYQKMVCVESGNVASNTLKLKPGETAVLTVTLSSEPWG